MWRSLSSQPKRSAGRDRCPSGGERRHWNRERSATHLFGAGNRQGDRPDRDGRARLLRCPRPDPGEGRPRVRQRSPPAPSRARARNRLGARAAEPDPRPPVAPDGHELGVRVRPLAGDHRLGDRPVRLAPGPLRPAAERDVHLGPARVRLLRGLSGRASAVLRSRARRHHHQVLGGLSRPPAPGSDEQVRGLPEPARRLEPARRHRPLPGDDASRGSRLRVRDAGGDGLRRRRDSEPLRPRRRGGHRARADRLCDSKVPERAYNATYT